WNDYQSAIEQYKNWTTADVRRRLDDLSPDGFVWDAYSPNRIAPHLIPFEINDGAELWSATVPLICFETVEWHPTDRVRRQFGFQQDPPVEPMKLGASHNIVLTGPKNKNWGVEHEKWISQWLNSPASVLTGAHGDHYQPSEQYMDWYVRNFGHHLRLSEHANEEQQPQQEQSHQQEQPAQQQHPPWQDQQPYSQPYTYPPYPYLPHPQAYAYPPCAQPCPQPFTQPVISYPPYSQEYAQPFTQPTIQPYTQASTMHEEYIPTQAPHYSLTQILGTSTHDEEQYRHIIDWVQGPESSQWVDNLFSTQDPVQVPVPQEGPGRLSLDASRPPRSFSEYSMPRSSVDSGRSVHRGIGCRQTPTRISMPEEDEEETDNVVEETSAGEHEVDQLGLVPDAVDEGGTSDEMVDEAGAGALDKGYDLRIDPARKSASRWSPSTIKKRVKKGCSKMARSMKKTFSK
ncbi:hypothetical protein S83_059978, partial [Arachis hypogaea]